MWDRPLVDQTSKSPSPAPQNLLDRQHERVVVGLHKRLPPAVHQQLQRAARAAGQRRANGRIPRRRQRGAARRSLDLGPLVLVQIVHKGVPQHLQPAGGPVERAADNQKLAVADCRRDLAAADVGLRARGRELLPGMGGEVQAPEVADLVGRLDGWLVGWLVGWR
jgi:hypothetical protein